MKPSITKRLTDSLYTSGAIAAKDILDAIKNKSSLTNLILMFGFVIFFFWMSTVRPFDKRIQAVIYDQGNSTTTFEQANLGDGYSFIFYPASSLEEMKRLLKYERIGVVLPADFDQRLANGEKVDLTGYILWFRRSKGSELEAKYSEKFSELLEQPVYITFDENFVIPPYDVDATSSNFTFLYVIMWSILALVPHLMLEEKRAKTLDALLVSPAGPGEVTIGKALAGLFYATILCIFFYAFYWVYVSNWGLVLLSFLLTALFSVSLALLIGNLIQSTQHLSLMTVVVVVFLLIPALFAQEAFLNATLKSILPWFPSAALTYLIQLSFSTPAPLELLLTNVAIAMVSTVLLFVIVVWQVRRSDR